MGKVISHECIKVDTVQTVANTAYKLLLGIFQNAVIGHCVEEFLRFVVKFPEKQIMLYEAKPRRLFPLLHKI